MLPYTAQRVGVFVDVQNLYYSARAMYEMNVNFGRLLQEASNGRQLIRAIAYVIKSEAPKEQGFFDALSKAGYEVKSKDIQIFADGQKKGDWDIGIAVDAIKIADRLDVVVLATGDGDFIPLVTYLRENRGCLVEGVSFERSTSAKLLETLDKFTDLGANPKQFMFRSR
ncbi:MAG: NYN domain-containing protein [Patescibacteria group bacterium]